MPQDLRFSALFPSQQIPNIKQTLNHHSFRRERSNYFAIADAFLMPIKNNNNITLFNILRFDYIPCKKVAAADKKPFAPLINNNFSLALPANHLKKTDRRHYLFTTLVSNAFTNINRIMLKPFRVANNKIRIMNKLAGRRRHSKPPKELLKIHDFTNLATKKP